MGREKRDGYRQWKEKKKEDKRGVVFTWLRSMTGGEMQEKEEEEEEMKQ